MCVSFIFVDVRSCSCIVLVSCSIVFSDFDVSFRFVYVSVRYVDVLFRLSVLLMLMLLAML